MRNPDDFEHYDQTDTAPLEACPVWANLLLDAAEGSLGEAQQRALDLHVLSCAGCAWELADAQRGSAWLTLLKGHAPEPPPNLLNAILEKTSGTEDLHGYAPAGFRPAPLGGGYPAVAAPLPGSRSSAGTGFSAMLQQLERWLGLDGGAATSLQPRFAMTAAMAFFSICLTLDLLGISVRSLNAESLRPAGLQRTVAQGSASLVRSFEGIRIVYRVESRVNEWRLASAPQGESTPGTPR